MPQNYSYRYGMLWLIYASVFCIIPSFNKVAFGQGIKPDSTLGSESSIVNPGSPLNNTPTDLITGGAIRGANLFHSFEQFNIDNGQSAYFSIKNLGIERIIARVTGSSRSEIFGTLGVTGGSADLFLLNPNGIIFGPNASLDLKGSFLATTASSFIFADTEYSAVEPYSGSPLSIHIPIGLQFRSSPGAIINQSRVVDPSSQIPIGLRVQPGKTLALVGGDIFMEEAILTAPGGRIELGSIADFGQVKLGKNWSLGYEDISNQNFGDIILKKTIFASLGRGGDIVLRGNNITVADVSQLGTFATTDKSGGTLKITASDSFMLTGGSQLISSSFSTGDSGDIVIDAKKVFLRDRSYIQTASTRTSSGQSGNVFITTNQMEISGGSYITAATRGVGRGGQILINADYINIFGVSPDNEFPPSGLYTNTFGRAEAGNITLNTRFLRVADGALISVKSEGTGAAGNLNINASSIRLENRGSLNAETTGELGNIFLNSDDIVLRGNSTISTSATGAANSGNITINTGVLVGLENSDIIANALNGSGGRISISAKGIYGFVLRSRDELPLQFDPSQLPSSDITAFSQSDPSLNGQVILSTPDTDPSKAKSEYPVKIFDPDALVAQTPCNRGSESEFTRSGRGGLPASPTQNLDHDTTQVSLVEPSSAQKGSSAETQRQIPSSQTSVNLPPSQQKQMAPAQGWVYNEKGDVVLVAYNPNVISPQRIKQNLACPVQ
jgi:filamentous hemagglutinin family protein